jgi:Flp pilus assembly protein CpaB
VSRRLRAAAFFALALLAAGVAALLANGYGARVSAEYGPLRPVVVVARGLPSDRPLGPEEAVAALELRRVPARFVPSGALSSPVDAVGLAPVAPLTAGSYLLASQLRPPRRRAPSSRRLGDRRRPVEISVSGAGALLAAGPVPRKATVDVVVTTEPTGAGPGRTYVAAAAVPLLALGPGPEEPGPGGVAAATLGLTRSQALRLIAAESFARKLTLLSAG